MKLFSSDESEAATATAEREPINYAAPWPDIPPNEKAAERTKRRVRMLSRVRLGPDLVAAVGDIVKLPHPEALSLVRTKRAEPV